MKSDHRHELKTNELADWLAHFPEWLKENQTTLIASAAVIVVAVAVYFWIFYHNNVAAARTQIRLTNLVTQLPKQKSDLAQAMAKQADQSYVLIDLAKDLGDFAKGASSGKMAALALIERGETLRTELHYRLGDVSPDDVAKQIAQAQESYTQAIEKAKGNPALTATARFGLGLCEEELGNVDKAKEIYRTVAEDQAYAGTSAQAAAALRLKTVDDYVGMITFKPAPEPPAQASTPLIQIHPGDANTPPSVTASTDANVPLVAPVPGDVNMGPAPAPAAAPDANAAAGN
ncbi:MAG: tetratricopeptide repeat protein [Sedimentisphaerales bacterium]|nr:tetratricopeptide repeat protein [Sedimentisphaerales bacterium]